MNPSSLSGPRISSVPPSRKQLTAEAKALLMGSDIQEKLAERGGFVWHVERWPNWLQISVDALGNASSETRVNEKVAQAWADEHQQELQELFGEVLGDRFGELAILGRPMGPEAHAGNCCRTGCGGCMNGTRQKLLGKLHGSEPVDQFRKTRKSQTASPASLF